jgi:hypothetical protein
LEHAYSLLTAVADKKKTIEDADLQEIIQTARTGKGSHTPVQAASPA